MYVLAWVYLLEEMRRGMGRGRSLCMLCNEGNSIYKPQVFLYKILHRQDKVG